MGFEIGILCYICLLFVLVYSFKIEHYSAYGSLLESLDGFDSAAQTVNNWHFAMLNDNERNMAYYKALKAVITSDSVVLDIGTGTSGLLAMMAARLGARKVFTVEENQVIAVVASETIARNGLSHLISVSICSSFMLTVDDSLDSHCSISERASVLVSEILSTTLTSEGVIKSVEDAKKRLCKPNVTVIPTSASLLTVVVQSDELFATSFVSQWGGFDLRAANVFRNTNASRFVDLSKVDDRKYLTVPRSVLSINFGQSGGEVGVVPSEYKEHLTSQHSGNIFIQSTNAQVQVQSGYAHFVCSWFSMQLSTSVYVSTDPEVEGSSNRMRQRHWGQSCIPTAVRGGDRRLHGPHQIVFQNLSTPREFMKKIETETVRKSGLPARLRALLVCAGDELGLSTQLDLNELRPEPRVSLRLPQRVRKSCH